MDMAQKLTVFSRAFVLSVLKGNVHFWGFVSDYSAINQLLAGASWPLRYQQAVVR